MTEIKKRRVRRKFGMMKVGGSRVFLVSYSGHSKCDDLGYQ